MEDLREVELTSEELEDLTGGKWAQAQCNYIWTMCLLYPMGCTNPCQLYYEHCT